MVNGPRVVIGHASGSRVARTSAAHHPELVTRLIVFAPAGAVPGAAAIESLPTGFWETPLPREAPRALLQRTFFAPENKPP
jgi:pimeloyl-ACP methyl ester carboxylesterase